MLPRPAWARSGASSPLAARPRLGGGRGSRARQAPPPPRAALLSDPHRVLGLDRKTATEADVKAAHRRLVKAHHPDARRAADGDAEAATFLAIQAAYEILTGRAAGKEAGGRPEGGWDFHDWYWSFNLRARRRRARGGGPGGGPPPPPGAWRGQVEGLRAKAAARRAAAARAAAAPGAPRPPAPAPAADRAWRSATKNARASQQQPAAARPAAPGVEPPRRAAAVAAAPAAAADAAPPRAAAAPPPPQQPAGAPTLAARLDAARGRHDASVGALRSHAVALTAALRAALGLDGAPAEEEEPQQVHAASYAGFSGGGGGGGGRSFGSHAAVEGRLSLQLEGMRRRAAMKAGAEAE